MALKEKLVLFLKGVVMGLAQIVPGVSAGAMAIVTNIYERFIEAVHSLSPFTEEKVEVGFLVTLGLGMVLSFFSMALVIPTILKNYESIIFAFFFGLIAAAAVSTYWKTTRVDEKTVLLASVGFILAFLFSGIEPLGTYHALPLLFVAGFLSVCAMLLPGISGSFVMLLLGQYEYMLNALSQFWIYWIDITVVLGGMFTALFTFPGVIDRLLKWDKAATLSFLIGLMLGALRLPVRRMDIGPGVVANIPLLAAGGIGLFSVLYLEFLNR